MREYWLSLLRKVRLALTRLRAYDMPCRRNKDKAEMFVCRSTSHILSHVLLLVAFTSTMQTGLVLVRNSHCVDQVPRIAIFLSS